MTGGLLGRARPLPIPYPPSTVIPANAGIQSAAPPPTAIARLRRDSLRLDYPATANATNEGTMHLTAMDIKDTPPFTELVELDFDERVNLFIGPNASGKSVLLREMDAAFDSEDRRPDSQDWKWKFSRPSKAYVHKGMNRHEYEALKSDRSIDRNTLLFTSKDWPGSFSMTGVSRGQQPPIVYIGPVRLGLPELHDESASEEDTDVSAVLSRPFSGANFNVANEKIHQKADSMFDQEKKEDAPLDERRAHRIYEINQTVHPCIRAICAEVLTSSDPHTGTELRNYVAGFHMNDLDFQPLANLGDVKIHRSMGINTIDKPNFSNVRPEDRPTYSEEMGEAPLHPSFLSSGTQITFLWIRWLAFKMLDYYDFAEGWKDKPAILLIDEIENHLHPTWQRRVIPALLEHFPGLQIFATTHSPFVVAGLRAGQVHLLDRNSEGVVTATTTEQDIIGWTTDEILRSFMGVAEPTDELTIQRTKRLRELRRKDSLSDEEREELETLRRQVNADILSSRSSLELQDERYADMMMRFIEARQNELSQDDR